MKRISSPPLMASLFVTGLVSCGGNATKTDSSDKGTETKAAKPDDIGLGKMDDFFKMPVGTRAGSTKAYNTYATKSFKDYNGNVCMEVFCDYELKKPKIIKREGMCSTIETASGITTRTYKVCRSNDSISGIDFVGRK